jgi:hypothetical protein
MPPWTGASPPKMPASNSNVSIRNYERSMVLASRTHFLKESSDTGKSPTPICSEWRLRKTQCWLRRTRQYGTWPGFDTACISSFSNHRLNRDDSATRAARS